MLATVANTLAEHCEGTCDLDASYLVAMRPNLGSRHFDIGCVSVGWEAKMPSGGESLKLRWQTFLLCCCPWDGTAKRQNKLEDAQTLNGQACHCAQSPAFKFVFLCLFSPHSCLASQSLYLTFPFYSSISPHSLSPCNSVCVPVGIIVLLKNGFGVCQGQHQSFAAHVTETWHD